MRRTARRARDRIEDALIDVEATARLLTVIVRRVDTFDQGPDFMRYVGVIERHLRRDMEELREVFTGAGTRRAHRKCSVVALRQPSDGDAQ
jgi:hypothetical protein